MLLFFLDHNLSVSNEEPDCQNHNGNKLVCSPNNLQDSVTKKEETDKDEADTKAKLQLLLASQGVSDAESSIIDVNNDQMFDDTVFTEYDDMNISKMTQKMSNHWRNKFESESKHKTKKNKNKMSLEELVTSQTEKYTNPQQSNDSKCEDLHNITNNRARRKKPFQDTNTDLQLSGSEIGNINFERDQIKNEQI